MSFKTVLAVMSIGLISSSSFAAFNCENPLPNPNDQRKYLILKSLEGTIQTTCGPLEIKLEEYCPDPARELPGRFYVKMSIENPDHRLYWSSMYKDDIDLKKDLLTLHHYGPRYDVWQQISKIRLHFSSNRLKTIQYEYFLKNTFIPWTRTKTVRGTCSL